MTLDRGLYQTLLDARVFEPRALVDALSSRRRRTVAGTDGKLLILAADHTARGKISLGGDPLAMADRFTLLDRLVRCLAMPHVDGVLASADILEELAWLGALDGKLALGTINRGGIIGAQWELDDRITAYDVDHVESMGLDGGKTLIRIDHKDPSVARTIETVARISTELADRGIMSLIEPLPYVTGADGSPTLDTSDDALVKVVAIASGLGAVSAYTWLKVPASVRMNEVAGATTLPILLLGGEPGPNANDTFGLWEQSMAEPNVRGLVAGRALLYPNDGDAEAAVLRASSIVRPNNSFTTEGSS
ncbi:MAG: deoxyribose-phosphate aldolase [Microbacteriaceae bacterium]|nr:deoxyribose-phosphate aldolase [Microbacteriaceae bacterium]